MKDPPYIKKKRRYDDASSGSRDDSQSHMYIAGTGGADKISKQLPNANRLMQTKPLSFRFSTYMNTTEYENRS